MLIRYVHLAVGPRTYSLACASRSTRNLRSSGDRDHYRLSDSHMDNQCAFNFSSNFRDFS